MVALKASGGIQLSFVKKSLFQKVIQKNFKKHLQLSEKRGKISLDNDSTLKEWVDKPTLSYVMGVKMKKSDVCKVVHDLASPIADKNGCEIYDLEFKKEGSDYFLRVFLDMKNGERSVSLDECEAVSRELSDALDLADPISEEYVLEVSSPGLDRALRTEAHFKKFIGSKIDIGFYKAVNGSKTLTCRLNGFSDGVISAETPDGEISVKLTETTFVKISLDGIF